MPCMINLVVVHCTLKLHKHDDLIKWNHVNYRCNLYKSSIFNYQSYLCHCCHYMLHNQQHISKQLVY